jgi:hypothetical protein
MLQSRLSSRKQGVFLEKFPWVMSRNTIPPCFTFWHLSHRAPSMDAVSWFLQIPPNPRRTSRASTSTVSRLPSLFLRSSVRPSTPDSKPGKSRSVSWSPHVEVWRQPSRSVTWHTHVRVTIIPATAPRELRGRRAQHRLLLRGRHFDALRVVLRRPERLSIGHHG